MDFDIPLFALSYGPEEDEAVLATIRSKWISMGPHAVAVTNCTAPLHLAMQILGVGPGDEVIVGSLTFVATANAVRYVGASPDFCDITGPDSPNMDPTRLAQLITPRTRAIIVMHYGWFPCDMDPIMAAATQHGIPVVEDACHAPLSDYRGRTLGTIGAIGQADAFARNDDRLPRPGQGPRRLVRRRR